MEPSHCHGLTKNACKSRQWLGFTFCISSPWVSMFAPAAIKKYSSSHVCSTVMSRWCGCPIHSDPCCGFAGVGRHQPTRKSNKVRWKQLLRLLIDKPHSMGMAFSRSILEWPPVPKARDTTKPTASPSTATTNNFRTCFNRVAQINFRHHWEKFKQMQSRSWHYKSLY